MKNLGVFLKDYKRESVLGPLFKLLEASFELMVPLVVASVVDIGIRNGDQRYIISRCLVLAALGLIGLLCSVTAQYFAAKAAVGFGTKLRQGLFAHIQSLSLAACDRVGAAALITGMTGDVNQMQAGVNLVLRLFLRSPFIVFGAMIMAFTVDGQSAFLFVVLIPLLSLVVFAIILVGIPLFQKIQTGVSRIMQLTRENLTGVRVIRAFRREEEEKKQFEEENSRLLKLQIFTGRVTGLLNPLTIVMVNIAIIALLYTGARRVAVGALTQGAVIALVNYMSQILVELVKLANLIITVTRALASGKRIGEILALEGGAQGNQKEAKKEKAVSARTKEEGLQGQEETFLEFRHVYFRYPEAGEEALKDISFSVKKGEILGVIGGTGAGKSSLAQLLPRFYEIEKGSIYIEGQDIRDIPMKAMRERIGMVMQKAVLFRGTVRENLLWGREEAKEEELWEALRRAQAEEFVRNLEDQLDAKVEQEGRNFSGGQRQRLTIARALVRKPEILILDDSASALDYLTEANLRAALRELDPDTTIFLISQRASSVLHADNILVLEDGKIVGQGTHQELLGENSVYREIYESQFDRE